LTKPLNSYGLVFRSLYELFETSRRGSCIAVYGEYRKLSDFIKKIFICVSKMNESLKGLERHEGE